MRVGDIVSINDVRPGDIFVRVASSNTRLIGIVCTRYKDSLVHLGLAQNEAGSAETGYFLSRNSNASEVKILGLFDRCGINFYDGDFVDKCANELVDGDFGFICDIEGEFSGLAYKSFQMWGSSIVLPGRASSERGQEFLSHYAGTTMFCAYRSGRVTVENLNG